MSDLNSDGSSLGEGSSSSSSSRLPSRAQRHAAEMAREAELEERSRASELARMQTVNFLSKLTKEGHAKEYRKRENDELVERCYFSCTQGFVVMQDKRVRKEPDCTARCYIRMKDKGKQAASLIPDTPAHPLLTNKVKVVDEDDDDSRYRFRTLEDRYFYKARGRLAIAKHAEEEPTARSLFELEKIQAHTPAPTISRAEKLGLIPKRPMGPPPNYEHLYPLGTAVATRLHRFEKHLVRIYGPTYRALIKMPSLYADGSIKRNAVQIYESTINGDGFVLGQRMMGVGYDTFKKWMDSGNSEGGSGFPPLFPRPPNGRGDGGKSSEKSEDGPSS